MVDGEVFDPSHDQPGRDPVLGLGRERGVADFGDLRVGDPLPGCLVEDRTWVADRREGLLVDGSDGPADLRVHRHDEREPGAGAAARGHHST